MTDFDFVIISEVEDFIVNRGIKDYFSLIDTLKALDKTLYLKFVRTNTLHFNTYLEALRNLQQTIYDDDEPFY